MQNVKFKNIDEFLSFLPEDELEIVEQLRTLVFDCIPDCKEKLSYNVPYFRRKSSICFIWPSSVLWGKKRTYEGVRFGFTKGYLLTDATDYLERGTRKQVYWKDFVILDREDVEQLRQFLFEAVILDD